MHQFRLGPNTQLGDSLSVPGEGAGRESREKAKYWREALAWSAGSEEGVEELEAKERGASDWLAMDLTKEEKARNLAGVNLEAGKASK
jgi:hypothetical protein